MNGTAPTSPLDLISSFAAAAREPHTLPVPAAVVVVESWRRAHQRRFNEVGLPRGLRKVA